jgi:hypothetical protein
MTMAKSKSTSRVRSSRNSANTEHRATANTNSDEVISALESVEDVVEQERARLMCAEAVLHCAVIAMDDDERDSARSPHYPSVVELARSLITQSIDQLDSPRLKPMLERICVHGDHGVKESTPVYLH